jgi:hypothetical protein
LAYVSSLDEVTLFLFDLCEKLFTADRKFNWEKKKIILEKKMNLESIWSKVAQFFNYFRNLATLLWPCNTNTSQDFTEEPYTIFHTRNNCVTLSRVLKKEEVLFLTLLSTVPLRREDETSAIDLQQVPYKLKNISSLLRLRASSSFVKYNFKYKQKRTKEKAGHSGRAVWGVGLGCWDRGFESRLMHGCLSASFCVVLSCVGRGLATGWSLVQGILPYV